MTGEKKISRMGIEPLTTGFIVKHSSNQATRFAHEMSFGMRLFM
jgi:hypothetical protein